MSTHKGYALIAILTTAVVSGVIPAFAANELACPDCIESGYDRLESYKGLVPIIIWTDRATYSHSDEIMVSGHVKSPNPGKDVTLKVVGPTGNVVNAKQFSVDDNGDFEATLDTGLWKADGVYRITAQYGSSALSDIVQVELLGSGSGACGPSNLAVVAKGDTYCIPYTITGATVVDGSINTDSATLTVQIAADSDGDLTLDIPRDVLDMINEKTGADERFLVFVNDEEADIYSEEKDDITRSVTIQFEGGVETIDIIGNKVVPEFGAIAAVVLAIAIISIIAVSAKTRLMPKY